MSDSTLRSCGVGGPARNTATSQSESGRASPRARAVQQDAHDPARQRLLGAPLEFADQG